MAPNHAPRGLENSFYAGTVVTGDAFADREDEVALLREEHGTGTPYPTARFRRGSVNVAPNVVRAIVAGAEGNPHYMMGLCRALLSRGVHAGRPEERCARAFNPPAICRGRESRSEPSIGRGLYRSVPPPSKQTA